MDRFVNGFPAEQVPQGETAAFRPGLGRIGFRPVSRLGQALFGPFGRRLRIRSHRRCAGNGHEFGVGGDADLLAAFDLVGLHSVVGHQDLFRNIVLGGNHVEGLKPLGDILRIRLNERDQDDLADFDVAGRQVFSGIGVEDILIIDAIGAGNGIQGLVVLHRVGKIGFAVLADLFLGKGDGSALVGLAHQGQGSEAKGRQGQYQ